MSKNKKILIAVPNTGNIHKSVVMSLMKLQYDPRYLATFILPTWVPSEHNRNRITKDAVEQGYDYCLMIDSDNPPQRNPLDLVELDLDIVGCPTPVWHNSPDNAPGDPPFYINAMSRVEDGWKEFPLKEGLQEVDAVGAGCILIARRVLCALYDKQPWNRVYDKYGIPVEGSDYAFCKRAKSADFKVWAHYDYFCEHYHEFGIAEAVNALAASAEQTDRHGESCYDEVRDG